MALSKCCMIYSVTLWGSESAFGVVERMGRSWLQRSGYLKHSHVLLIDIMSTK